MKIHLALSLALHSLWHRKKVLALVCLTLTLSVTLLLGIQYLRTEVKQSFTSTISGTEILTKLALYYGHERIWARSRFGLRRSAASLDNQASK